MKCQFCLSSFNKSQLLEHYTTEHGIDQKNIKFNSVMHKCQGCDKYFSDQSELVQHFSICPTLSKNKKVKVESIQHTESFAPAQKINENFSESIDVAKTSNIEIPKAFSTKTKKNVTKLEMKYGCNVCGKKFLKENKLKVHIVNVREKIKKRIFNCEFCSSSFTQKLDLLKHITNVHPDMDNSDLLKEYKYECGICCNIYKSLSNLKIHITEVHENIRLYHCEHCSASFSVMYKLRKHLSNWHNIDVKDMKIKNISRKLHKCYKCKKYFADQLDLKKHSATCTTMEKNMKVKVEEIQQLESFVPEMLNAENLSSLPSNQDNLSFIDQENEKNNAENKHTCGQCGMSFLKGNKLN